MRLVDADALKQTFCAECDRSIKCDDCDIDYHFEYLAPTVDAVPVVRCKDCTSFYSGWCCDFGIHMDDNEFCSGGERRED